MPLRLDDIEKYGAPISFMNEGEVSMRVGPCSASFWHESKIPLDGRHYICAGKVILKNGLVLRANFEIKTHTFNFLEEDTVTIFIKEERAWYYMKEDELYEKIGVHKEDALPYTWMPDRPLDRREPGPYPIKQFPFLP